MILKGSQRGGSLQLATHLLNDLDNDHVTLHEVRGFVAEDLHGALAEAYAVSKGTKCRQFMFSLSLNPPKDADCKLEDMVAAADRAEELLGLKGQPRAIVVHEKEGRRHIHAVWSRIDSTTMKAVELPFFKNRLAGLSKELYLEHGWDLPEGHRENGWKNPLNFTLAEWQQCRRIGLDPREVKQLFADAWRYSDGAKSFRAALEDRGYFLAAGDRRGFVAVDLQGEVFSVARMAGVRTKELNERLGSPDRLPSVSEVQERNRTLVPEKVRSWLREYRREQIAKLDPVKQAYRETVRTQREERKKLLAGQRRRWLEEQRARQGRMRRGVRGLWDVLIGRAGQVRRQNELEVIDALRRDSRQREELFALQLQERRQQYLEVTEQRALQRQSFMQLARHTVKVLGLAEKAPPVRRRRKDNSLEFGL